MKFASVVQPATERPVSGWSDRMTPRAPSVASDTGVPLTQALAVGGMAGIAASLLAVLVLGAGWYCLAVFVVVTCIVSIPVFWSRMQRYEATLYAREITEGVDLNGDGNIGQPIVKSVAHLVNTTNFAGAKRDLELGDWEHILLRAYDVGLGYRKWEGHTLPSGQVIDESQWRACINELARLGVCEVAGDRKTAQIVVPRSTALRAFGFDEAA